MKALEIIVLILNGKFEKIENLDNVEILNKK
jgi:hypothetical protein